MGGGLPDPPAEDAQCATGHAAEGQCRVCGTEPAGRHYGSVCCSGCKGFFRRSVRFQKLYRCPYERKCSINKKYRNCCRACRFQKCQYIGLDPNLVHGDWGQSGSSRGVHPSCPSTDGSVPRSPPDSLPNLASVECHNSSSTSSTNAKTISTNSETSSSAVDNSPIMRQALVQHNRLLNPDKCESALGYGKGKFGPSGDDCISLSNYFMAIESFGLCDLFVDCPIPPDSHPKDIPAPYNLDVPIQIALKQPGKVSPRTPIGWTGQHLISKETLARAYCRVMVHYFDWVSHVPELNELTEEDRQNLITKRAMRCIWLLCAFRSALLNIEGVAGCCELMFPYSPAERERLDPELKDMFLDSATLAFNELVLPFRALRISEPEYALLRALCLFSPVSRLSESGRVQVARAQAKYLNALGELVRRKNADGSGDGWEEGGGAIGRMSKLMMFLATIEQVAQLDDNAFALLNVFNLAGIRGLLTYDIHIRSLDENPSQGL